MVRTVGKNEKLSKKLDDSFRKEKKHAVQQIIFEGKRESLNEKKYKYLSTHKASSKSSKKKLIKKISNKRKHKNKTKCKRKKKYYGSKTSKTLKSHVKIKTMIFTKTSNI